MKLLKVQKQRRTNKATMAGVGRAVLKGEQKEPQWQVGVCGGGTGDHGRD